MICNILEVSFQRAKMQHEFTSELAGMVRAYRARHNLTQAQFADEVGISYAGICRLERKKILPRGPVLNRITAVLKAETNPVTRETQPAYGPEPYLAWLQQLIASDEPYAEKLRAIHDSSIHELHRIRGKTA